MRVTLFPCGQMANESELNSFQNLKTRLMAEPGDDEWVLLTNLAFSVTRQLQSDEIDIVAIGPPGVRVIEVKHWSPQWIDTHKFDIEFEADRLTMKARKIGTTLRNTFSSLPHVDGALLLTHEANKTKRIAGQQVRGVTFYTLNDWRTFLGLNAQTILSPPQIRHLATILQPRSIAAIDGSLRRLAGYVNLELQTSKDQRFDRVYKGNHPERRDRVVLHLYDLSATSEDKNAENKAKREFEALRHVQLFSWAPRILDSFQEAPGYAGEMFFFTLVDPAAPNLKDRMVDKTWTTISKLTFARNTVRSLAQLHTIEINNKPLLHRNLTPETILVKHDDSPIFIGFEFTKIPSEVSITSDFLPETLSLTTIAPEVRKQGLSAADSRSDVYSLCACLVLLFQDQNDSLGQQAFNILRVGTTNEPEQRSTLEDLNRRLTELLGESVPKPVLPPARFWTEDQVIRFRDRDYRILSRLGSGGVGTTFKVLEVDRSTKEDLGTYVAKVVHERETGQRVLKAYNLVRSHLRHTALSTIFEVARDWNDNEFVALMTWVSGTPLSEYRGIFPLLAEEHQETSSEGLALRWLRVICDALDVLHRNGLIHGDVSPRNLIVSGSDLVLTDYDFVTKINDVLVTPGTQLYGSPSCQEGRLASPSDDLYALATSFFHVVFDKEPFRYGETTEKSRGLNWEEVDTTEYPIIVEILNKATHPNPELRFVNASEVIADLKMHEQAKLQPLPVEREPKSSEQTDNVDPIERSLPKPELSEQRVNWLLPLLQSYPGSRWGNQETRGLDTDFASQTYVETILEETLVQDIRNRRVRLVILCGNAGDGKTALLQHIATQLGLGKHESSERILTGSIANGPLVYMNLDGSASWQGRSSDDLLDEFFAPFQDGPPAQDIIHLLAINDGRLLEWIESAEERYNGTATPLTEELYKLLQQEEVMKPSHIRFITLNQRSLVGGILLEQNKIDTTFLDRLLNRLYGGEQAVRIWEPCLTCSANERCQVYQTARIFGPDTLPALVEKPIRTRSRQRLFEALQAVHLRGETHITMRELRAAVVYILFGVHFCDDYHTGIDEDKLPYWDRAFVSHSLARQGEVLGELVRFDPAMEAHPQIDRYLLSTGIADSLKSAPRYPQLTLESARRRAFFEWTTTNIEQVSGDKDALDLARGRHLRQFRNLPLADESELAEVCQRLCMGISRLEDLPPQALDRAGIVPLRITPRTPTETALWVEKSLDRFHLEVDLPIEVDGLERLHRQVFLTYHYRNEGNREHLRLSAELFHLLMELADGYQLGDVSTDDTFANLSIFVQRLVREDEQELLAWNPMNDEAIYKISSAIRQTESGPHQKMIITSLVPGALI